MRPHFPSRKYYTALHRDHQPSPSPTLNPRTTFISYVMYTVNHVPSQLHTASDNDFPHVNYYHVSETSWSELDQTQTSWDKMQFTRHVIQKFVIRLFHLPMTFFQPLFESSARCPSSLSATTPSTLIVDRFRWSVRITLIAKNQSTDDSPLFTRSSATESPQLCWYSFRENDLLTRTNSTQTAKSLCLFWGVTIKMSY